MSKVLYEADGRIGRITLNRPEVMNAIDNEVPGLIADAVAAANADPAVHVIILSGNGPAFCAAAFVICAAIDSARDTLIINAGKIEFSILVVFSSRW